MMCSQAKRNNYEPPSSGLAGSRDIERWYNPPTASSAHLSDLLPWIRQSNEGMPKTVPP